MPEDQSATIAAAAKAISEADAVLVAAGAGMGVDSGLPDFRGAEGFWKAYPVMRDRGIDFASMANPRWFVNEPRLAWGFYGHRLNLYRAVEPHAGFARLRQMVAGKSVFVFTSNVDEQFQKAGFEPTAVVEIHGSIHWLQTLAGNGRTWSAKDVQVTVDERTFLAEGPLPRAADGQIARPNILMFGDWQFDDMRVTLQSERYGRWRRRLSNKRVVVIEIGAGTTIPSVRRESEGMQRAGATLVRINPREAFGPQDTLSIEMGGRDGLCAIADAMGLG